MLRLVFCVVLLATLAVEAEAGGFRGRRFPQQVGPACGQNFNNFGGFRNQFGPRRLGAGLGLGLFFGPVPVARSFDQFGRPVTQFSDGSVAFGHHF